MKSLCKGYLALFFLFSVETANCVQTEIWKLKIIKVTEFMLVGGLFVYRKGSVLNFLSVQNL